MHVANKSNQFNNYASHCRWILVWIALSASHCQWLLVLNQLTSFVAAEIPGTILSTRDELPGPAITPSSDWKIQASSTNFSSNGTVFLFFKPSFIARHVAIFSPNQLEIHQFEVAGASEYAPFIPFPFSYFTFFYFKCKLHTQGAISFYDIVFAFFSRNIQV